MSVQCQLHTLAWGVGVLRSLLHEQFFRVPALCSWVMLLNLAITSCHYIELPSLAAESRMPAQMPVVPLAIINLGVCRRPGHADRELTGRRPTAHHEVEAPTIVRDSRHIVQGVNWTAVCTAHARRESAVVCSMCTRVSRVHTKCKTFFILVLSGSSVQPS